MIHISEDSEYIKRTRQRTLFPFSLIIERVLFAYVYGKAIDWIPRTSRFKTSGTVTTCSAKPEVNADQHWSSTSCTSPTRSGSLKTSNIEEGGIFVCFADFGSTLSLSAVPYLCRGSVSPSGATIIDTEQNSVLTSVSTTSSGITVKYI